MDGTTLCPHCHTRFKITAAQLAAHHGMVRCGLCQQAFDARPNFVPDLPDQQLELPVPEEHVAPAQAQPAEPPIPAADTSTAAESAASGLPEQDTSDFNPLYEPAVLMPERFDRPKRRTWPWTVGSLLLLLLLLAQAAYYFRIELAARLPGLKPALIGYCELLQCSVPLPQKAELLSIESSGLEAEPANENQITLSALLRNRAGYAQAFPHLELTLHDSQDKPLARRIFRPAEYLPPGENETAGLPANRELSLKLRLTTISLKPMGYCLVLFYPPR